MQEPGQSAERFEIQYFDGINSTVQHKLAKRSELYHGENVRSPVIGVLEKRRGQSKVDTGGATMAANYGLFKFSTTDSSQKGVFKISAPSSTANIYSLDTSDNWSILPDSDAQGIAAGTCDFANVNGDMVIVNRQDENRVLDADGGTVKSSSDAGNLYNSPNASKVAFYKGRIYLADYIVGSERYKTSVVRSSYGLGIMALVNGDYDNDGGSDDWVIPVTDSKYFYSASGMNQYEVYRGATKVADITISSIQENTITATNSNVSFAGSFDSFLSSDEIWVSGTFTGGKQYRWVNNSSVAGRDVKQYNTFQLSGGEEDAINLFEPIGNVLFIGNKNNIMTWDDYNLLNYDYGIGCVSSKGYAKLLGSLFFVHYSGVYVTTGGAPKLISRKVSRYISGATKVGLESSAIGVKGLSVFITVGDVSLYKKDGSMEKTLKDVCLEYSIADENWYVHTNVPSNMFLTFMENNGNERILMAHTGAGKHIKEFLDDDVYTDDGSEIFMRADTQEIQLMREFETYVCPISVLAEVDRGAMIKVMVHLDGEEPYELEGYLKKGVSKLKIHSRDRMQDSPPRCRKLRLSFRDMSKQICRINQVAVVYLPSAMEDEDAE